MNTVYVSIGNSYDKLTQRDWSSFYWHTNAVVREHAETVHGAWVSQSTSAWQNACWCIEIDDEAAGFLAAELSSLANVYHQDSIAWAEATTKFIEG